MIFSIYVLPPTCVIQTLVHRPLAARSDALLSKRAMLWYTLPPQIKVLKPAIPCDSPRMNIKLYTSLSLVSIRFNLEQLESIPQAQISHRQRINSG
jgi:hypothetical protein